MTRKPVAEGNKAPDFELVATGGKPVRLSELRGRPVVVYFYPKDNTPGCTAEGQDFRDLYPRFRRRRTLIFGISRDTLKTHENFRAKHKFPFQLLSDPDEIACKRYDVIKMKNLYGRKVRGIERSTFLIDPQGVVRRVWRKVRVPEHAADVLAAVIDLPKA